MVVGDGEVDVVEGLADCPGGEVGEDEDAGDECDAE